MQDSTSGEESKLDEAHNRIYLMSWNATELIVYGLHGNLLPSIPLNSTDEKPWKLPEAVFHVDGEKQEMTVRNRKQCTKWKGTSL